MAQVYPVRLASEIAIAPRYRRDVMATQRAGDPMIRPLVLKGSGTCVGRHCLLTPKMDFGAGSWIGCLAAVLYRRRSLT